MGPDCGTGHHRRARCAFANTSIAARIASRRSGTARMEVSCLISESGEASHAIGVGGREPQSGDRRHHHSDAIAALDADPDRSCRADRKPAASVCRQSVLARIGRSPNPTRVLHRATSADLTANGTIRGKLEEPRKGAQRQGRASARALTQVPRPRAWRGA